jgi:hypothetical protein
MSTMRKARAEKTRAATISIFQRNPNRPLRTLDISATIRMTAAKEGWEPLEALAQLVNMMRKESEVDPSRYGGIIERVRTGHYQFIPPFLSPIQPRQNQSNWPDHIEKALKDFKENIELTVAAMIKAAGIEPKKETEEKK